MGYTINAHVTPSAAVRLLIMNDLSLNGYWNMKQAETILDQLYETEIVELLKIVDFIEPTQEINSSTLPQFGSLETLIRVPEVLVSTGIDGLSYTQLGFYLKGDIRAKQGSNQKYGETHGKGACQLGITYCDNNKVRFGALTNAFHGIEDKRKQYRIAQLLCFRIPVIQTLLNLSKKQRINGFSIMSHLSTSTQIRRSICVKMILRELVNLEDNMLTNRINNIYWDIEEGDNQNAKV